MSSAIPHEIAATYDLVFAGGGTTALITATRLAAAFPDLTILVLESGPTTRDKPEHTIPGNYMQHLRLRSTTMQFYPASPSPHLLGRSLVVPSGKCVGGGSSVNFMLYNRPAASDFDNWEREFVNAGWRAKDLIPLLQQAETYELDPPSDTHGFSGPLRVSFGGDVFDVGKQLLEIGPQFEQGRPRGYAGNEFAESDVNQFFHMPKWISKNSGTRSDVAHHYLYNKNVPNLWVLDGCRVNRVLTEFVFLTAQRHICSANLSNPLRNGIATGVEYLFDKRTYANAPQSLCTVTARRLVVVSAGAMGSPLILDRSGIGRRDVLARAGVDVVVELDGVGEGYQDHVAVFTPYLADPETRTMDPLFRREPEETAAALVQYTESVTGLMATNGVDGVIKMRPLPDELPDLGPVFKEYWDKALGPYPDKPLFWFCATGGLPIPDQPGLPPTKYTCAGVFLGYPASRGHLHIASTDLYADPDFDGGYLSHPADVAALRWGYKKGRELMRRLPAYRGPFLPAHPQFPAGSAAAWAADGEAGPVAIDAPTFVYTEEDDAAIDLHTRALATTVWHSMGTCAMKPRENGGVVDSKLNVYGVRNLKVADLSIAPSNVNANTYSTAIAIGEKAAVIIAQELGGEI
ncbi:Alcohol oxidase [Mycena kentingensis (nom. inval.)]|nr:Alcohol oxidase [Mycena kentingensis (nom. inval.)]